MIDAHRGDEVDLAFHSNRIVPASSWISLLYPAGVVEHARRRIATRNPAKIIAQQRHQFTFCRIRRRE